MGHACSGNSCQGGAQARLCQESEKAQGTYQQREYDLVKDPGAQELRVLVVRQCPILQACTAALGQLEQGTDHATLTTVVRSRSGKVRVVRLRARTLNRVLMAHQKGVTVARRTASSLRVASVKPLRCPENVATCDARIQLYATLNPVL